MKKLQMLNFSNHQLRYILNLILCEYLGFSREDYFHVIFCHDYFFPAGVSHVKKADSCRAVRWTRHWSASCGGGVNMCLHEALTSDYFASLLFCIDLHVKLLYNEHRIGKRFIHDAWWKAVLTTTDGIMPRSSLGIIQ